MEYEFRGDHKERGNGGLESHSKLQNKLFYRASDSKTKMKDAREAILALAPDDFTISLSTRFNYTENFGEVTLEARLSMRYGIRDRAFKWFVSYLSDRTQVVKLDGSSSQSIHLPQGVPQGSVLGPILYSLYTSPLSDIANQHGMKCHFYADDSQFYVSFKTCCLNDMESNKSKMEACVRDIDFWMLCNRLKLNQDKLKC